MSENNFPSIGDILSAKIDNETSSMLIIDKNGNKIQCSIVVEDGIKKIKYGDTVVATYLSDLDNINSINLIDPVHSAFSIRLLETGDEGTFVSLPQLQVKDVSITENGDSDIMTITDANGNKYNFGITDTDNNGVFEVRDSKGNIVGSFNPETGKLEFTYGNTTITTNLVSLDVDETSFTNLEKLQIQDASLNLTEEPNTMVLTDVDGKEYKFNVVDTDNDGVFELLDAKGREIGSFNPSTGQMTFTAFDKNIVTNFVETNEENYFVNLETLDIKNISLDLDGEPKTATLTDVDGREYEFTITDKDGNGVYEILDANGNEIGTFDPNNGILDSAYISGTENFLLSGDGKYTNIDDIHITSYNVNLEDGKMTIYDGDTKYDVDIQLNSDDTYSMKFGNSVIGNYNPQSNEIGLNNDNDDVFHFAETQNGQNINLDSFDFMSGSVNIEGEEKSITLTGVDGEDYTFGMTQVSPGLYNIQDADGNIVGNYNSYTGKLQLGDNNESQVMANAGVVENNHDFVNVEFANFDSFTYTFDENTNIGSITFKIGDEEYTAYLKPGEDGKYEIQRGDNTFATFDRENGVVEFLESGKTESFILSSNNEFVNINNINNIDTIDCNIDPATNSGTITLHDGDVSYQLDLVLGEDGLYDVKFGDNVIGSFDATKNQLSLDNENQESFTFAEDINGKFVNLENLEVKSGSLNTDTNNFTITLVDENGVEYTFNIEDKIESGTYNISDANGNNIGTFNPSTGLLDLTQSGGEQTSFVVSKEGDFLNIEDLDVQGGSFDLEKKTITLLDEEGNSYTFDLGDVNKSGSADILFNGQSIGSFNTKTGELQLGDNDPINDFSVSYDNQLVDLSELNPKTLEFEYMKMDKDGTQIISITDEDGTEYQFSATKSSANPDIYIIKDAEGEVIATFNPKTGELFMGDNTEEPFATFMKTNDGKFVDPTKIEAENFECDYEKGTISITDKDGSTFEFNIQDTNGDGIFVIVDANNNKIGTLTPGDIESELDLSLSGGKSFDITTLSDENKQLFSKLFENSDLFSDFIRRNDYNGLKDALNDELENLIGEDNPELLEKAQNVVNDMNLDGVKTKEDFRGSLNESLENNGFNQVEDIKMDIPWQDILTSNGAIAGYISVGGIILGALIRALIKYLLEKNNDNEKQEEQNNFDPTVSNDTKNNSNKEQTGLGQIGTNTSNTSTPNNAPNTKPKNNEREKQ